MRHNVAGVLKPKWFKIWFHILPIHTWYPKLRVFSAVLVLSSLHRVAVILDCAMVSSTSRPVAWFVSRKCAGSFRPACAGIVPAKDVAVTWGADEALSTPWRDETSSALWRHQFRISAPRIPHYTYILGRTFDGLTWVCRVVIPKSEGDMLRCGQLVDVLHLHSGGLIRGCEGWALLSLFLPWFHFKRVAGDW